MHSVLGVEAGGRPDRFHASGRDVRQAVPDAGFLPDLGPVPIGRDRPRLAHLSRPQGCALRLFLRAVGDDPVRLQGAVLCRRDELESMSAICIWNPSSSRSARCGSSICCRSSSWSSRRRGGCPPLAIWGRRGAAGDGACRHRLDRDRRILRALRLFLFRLFVCATTCSRCRIARGRALLSRLRDWRCGRWSTAAWSGRASANGRSFRWRSGFAGACAIIVIGHAVGAHAMAELPALLRRAFHRHLSRLLPADGGDPDAAAADRPDPRHRHGIADRHHRGRGRRAGDLAGWRSRPAPISCSSGPAAFWIAPKKPRATLQAAE